MAVVETPDRIMTTGGFGENGGGSMWMLMMFAFLFLFRGHGDGFGGGEGRRPNIDFGGYDGGIYRRNDAEFKELHQENWSLQKENLCAKYEAQIAELRESCKTNDNISSVKCEVKEQGEKTRALMIELEQKETIQRLTEKNCALESKIGRDDIIAGVLAAMNRERGHGHRDHCDCDRF